MTRKYPEAPCASYKPFDRVCKDGFIQKPYCRGHGCCVTCGHTSNDYLPLCLGADIPKHLSREDGSTLFYQPARPGQEPKS